MPRRTLIPPQLAIPTSTPPTGDQWIHEVKWDGYRIIAELHDGRARLWSRRGYDYSDRAPQVAHEVASLADDVALDGELVVLGPGGVTDFEALQRALRSKRPSRNLTYVAWDLLRLDGQNWMDRPLLERKAELAKLLANLAGPIRYVDHIVGNGPEVYRLACDAGVEGIVSKLATSPYRPGKRLTSWLKTKCWQEQRCLVVGWTEPSRDYPFGSLLLARQDKVDGVLPLVGRVSLGYSGRQAERIRSKLEPLRTAEPPIEGRLPERWAVNAHWTSPDFLARVRYLQVTRAGHLRHANLKEIVPRPGMAA